MFEVFLDYGWWIAAIAAAVWLWYEWKRGDSRGSIGALIFSSAAVAFLFGVIITVHATGSVPEVITMWTGDPINETCSATIDTSRLTGFEAANRVALICGAVDPAIDPQDDSRIAVSSLFHVTGSPVTITVPLGKIKDVWKDVPIAPVGQATAIVLWHCAVLLPKDTDPTTVKRISDVARQGGRVISDPIAGHSNPFVVIPKTVTPVPSANVKQQ